MDCIFCKIINGDIPSYTIYEDEVIKVFLDISPISKGHSLIVPKKHFENILDFDEIDLDMLSKINIAAKKVKKLLEEKLNCDGIIIQQNNGCVQEVKHYHMHLVPRYEGDGFLSITPKEKYDVKEIYEKIKK